MRKPKKKDRELSGGARHRPKKPKANQDGYALWAPDAAKNPAGEDLKVMRKQIAESFKRLEPMPEGFRRQGGDRMVAFEHRLGGVNDDEVCVRITAGKHSNPLALEMEKPLPQLPNLPAPPIGLAALGLNGRRRVGQWRHPDLASSRLPCLPRLQ